MNTENIVYDEFVSDAILKIATGRAENYLALHTLIVYGASDEVRLVILSSPERDGTELALSVANEEEPFFFSKDGEYTKEISNSRTKSLLMDAIKNVFPVSDSDKEKIVFEYDREISSKEVLDILDTINSVAIIPSLHSYIEKKFKSMSLDDLNSFPFGGNIFTQKKDEKDDSGVVPFVSKKGLSISVGKNDDGSVFTFMGKSNASEHFPFISKKEYIRQELNLNSIKEEIPPPATKDNLSTKRKSRLSRKP